jgi:hypothetical protein
MKFIPVDQKPLFLEHSDTWQYTTNKLQINTETNIVSQDIDLNEKDTYLRNVDFISDPKALEQLFSVKVRRKKMGGK